MYSLFATAFDKLRNGPRALFNACGLRWRHANGSVRLDEVVIAEVQGETGQEAYLNIDQDHLTINTSGNILREKGAPVGVEKGYLAINSGDPKSPHFNDQAARDSTGDLREVYFYRPDVERHLERKYHPGE